MEYQLITTIAIIIRQLTNLTISLTSKQRAERAQST